MERPRTRMMTLHRLIGLTSIDDAPRAVVVPDSIEGSLSDSARVEVDHHLIWWAWAQGAPGPVAWTTDVKELVGSELEIVEQRAGAVVVIHVDDALYALGFGQGFRWIKEEFRDQRFGLRVAIRCLDKESLHGIVRRRPGQGRVETSHVPGGAPVAWLRPTDLSEIVRRVEGKALPLELTYRPSGKRINRLQGSSGLRLRLGMDGSSLIRDIRTIAEIHARPTPLPELAFVDDVAPVQDEDTEAMLNARLDGMLGDDISTSAIALAVPDSAIADMDRVRSYQLRVGSHARRTPDLLLDDLVTAAAKAPEGERVTALEQGRVLIYEEEHGGRNLHHGPAIRWIEASVIDNERHYALLDGVWHEFGNDFSADVRREVADVLTGSTWSGLPPWYSTEDEETYNKRVARQDTGFTCLDRRLAADGDFHTGRGLEVCDLLGPDLELIHVKRAKGSAVLSHLFAQGLVSWQSLTNHRETRLRFRELVQRYGNGRTLPDGFEPRRIVFAIQLGTGRPLSADTLFPFAQAALAQTARALRNAGLRLDVIGIPAVDQASAAA